MKHKNCRLALRVRKQLPTSAASRTATQLCRGDSDRTELASAFLTAETQGV